MTRVRHGKVRRKPLLICCAVVIVALIGLGWWMWSKAAARPEWWALPTQDVRVQASVASDVENSVVTALHEHRGSSESDQEWTLRLTEQEANAWLSTRLPKWSANQFPDSPVGDGTIGLVQVRFEPDLIRLGVQIYFGSSDHNPSITEVGDGTSVPAEPEPDGGHIISVCIRPEMVSDGDKMTVAIEDFMIGRLSLPASQAFSMIGDLLADIQDVESAVSGAPFTPMIRLVDDRAVRLLDVTVQDQLLIVRLRTGN
ncbi:MAG: hypothetical protein HND57_00875 [Planctomycetes bacterium]|nr:hypothetical protein [Planctomycetota bacterium]